MRRRAGRTLADCGACLVSLGLRRSRLLYRLGNAAIDRGLDWEYPLRRNFALQGGSVDTSITKPATSWKTTVGGIAMAVIFQIISISATGKITWQSLLLGAAVAIKGYYEKDKDISCGVRRQ